MLFLVQLGQSFSSNYKYFFSFERFLFFFELEIIGGFLSEYKKFSFRQKIDSFKQAQKKFWVSLRKFFFKCKIGGKYNKFFLWVKHRFFQTSEKKFSRVKYRKCFLCVGKTFLVENRFFKAGAKKLFMFKKMFFLGKYKKFLFGWK